VRIEAENAEQAARLSGYGPGTIVSVDKDVLGNLVSQFTDPRPELNVQQIVLSNLSAMVEAGASGEQAIRALLAKVSYIRYDEKSLAHCQTVPEYLRALKFDNMVVLLARAGQESGDLAGSLYKAAEYVEEQIKLKEESGRGIMGGVLKMAMGIGAMLFLPLLMGPQVEKFMEMKGVKLRPTIFTDILLAIQQFERNYWYLIPIIAVAVFVARKPIWNSIKSLPLFRMWVDIANIRRALSFISTYAVMIEAKVPTEKAIEMISAEMAGADRDIFLAIRDRLQEGSFLADALDPELWPESMRSGLANFDRIDESQRTRVLRSIGNNLRLEQRAVMRGFERLAGMLGMGTLILAILIAVLGFYSPLVTMSPEL
jgi:type II secretory pathway component PulF